MEAATSGCGAAWTTLLDVFPPSGAERAFRGVLKLVIERGGAHVRLSAADVCRAAKVSTSHTVPCSRAALESCGRLLVLLAMEVVLHNAVADEHAARKRITKLLSKLPTWDDADDRCPTTLDALVRGAAATASDVTLPPSVLRLTGAPLVVLEEVANRAGTTHISYPVAQFPGGLVNPTNAVVVAASNGAASCRVA